MSTAIIRDTMNGKKVSYYKSTKFYVQVAYGDVGSYRTVETIKGDLMLARIRYGINCKFLVKKRVRLLMDGCSAHLDRFIPNG